MVQSSFAISFDLDRQEYAFVPLRAEAGLVTFMVSLQEAPTLVDACMVVWLAVCQLLNQLVYVPRL